MPEYLIELENEHKRSLLLLNNMLFINKAFPEGSEILRRNKRIYEQEIIQYKNDLERSVLQAIIDELPPVQVKLILLFKYLNQRFRELRNCLHFINSQMPQTKNLNKTKTDYISIKIQRSKEIDIRKVVEYLGLEVKSNDILRCPFHQDKTPSLKLYRKENRFKCYGCNASGDSITFVRKFQNVGFLEAIDFINKL